MANTLRSAVSEEAILRELSDTRDETVSRAAMRLNLPELQTTQKQLRHRQMNLKRSLSEIEAMTDFPNAKYLVDPNHGEIALIKDEKTQLRTEMDLRLKRYSRHEAFLRLAHGKPCGLAWTVPLFLIGVAFIALGGYGEYYGSTDAAMFFGGLGLVPAVISFFMPGIVRRYLAGQIVKDFGCPSFQDCLLEHGRLKKDIERLGNELAGLRNRELRIQGMVIRHRRYTDELAQLERTWQSVLCNCALKAFGIRPSNDAEPSGDTPVTATNTGAASHNVDEGNSACSPLQLANRQAERKCGKHTKKPSEDSTLGCLSEPQIELAPYANIGRPDWNLYGNVFPAKKAG